MPQCQYYSLADYISLQNNNSLSIISHNIRSYNRNFDSLLACFAPENMPTIFCLTETRFSAERTENITGYEAFETVLLQPVAFRC